MNPISGLCEKGVITFVEDCYIMLKIKYIST